MTFDFGPTVYDNRIGSSYATCIKVEEGQFINTRWASNIGAENPGERRIKVDIPDGILQDVLNSGLPVKNWTSKFDPDATPVNFLDIRVNTEGNKWHPACEIYVVINGKRTKIEDNFGSRFDSFVNSGRGRGYENMYLFANASVADKDNKGNPARVILWAETIYIFVKSMNDFNERFAGMGEAAESFDEEMPF